MNFVKLFAAGGLALSLAACSSTTESTTDFEETESETLENVEDAELAEEVDPVEEEKIEAETTEGDVFEGTVGDTLSFDNIKVTLDSVSYSNEEADSLDDGYTYVTCEFTIQNGTEADFVYSPDYFSMEDADSVISSPEAFTIDASSVTDENEIMSADQTILAGSQLKGGIRFIEPDGSSPLLLRFDDAASEGERTLTWTINRE